MIDTDYLEKIAENKKENTSNAYNPLLPTELMAGAYLGAGAAQYKYIKKNMPGFNTPTDDTFTPEKEKILDNLMTSAGYKPGEFINPEEEARKNKKPGFSGIFENLKKTMDASFNDSISKKYTHISDPKNTVNIHQKTPYNLDKGSSPFAKPETPLTRTYERLINKYKDQFTTEDMEEILHKNNFDKINHIFMTGYNGKDYETIAAHEIGHILSGKSKNPINKFNLSAATFTRALEKPLLFAQPINDTIGAFILNKVHTKEEKKKILDEQNTRANYLYGANMLNATPVIAEEIGASYRGSKLLPKGAGWKRKASVFSGVPTYLMSGYGIPTAYWGASKLYSNYYVKKNGLDKEAACLKMLLE